MNKKIIMWVSIAVVVIIAAFLIIYINSKNISGHATINSLKNKVFQGDISKLTLDVSELPEGYEIAERSPRIKSDVAEEGLDLGWEEGYYIRYLNGDMDNLLDVSTIQISISRYPLENINKLIEIEPFELEGSIAELFPNPQIGEGSKAIRYTNKEDFLLVLTEYQIQFYKKDIFITMFMGGTTTDYELLKGLAKKVENKI